MESLLELYELVGILARRRHQRAEAEFAAIGLTHTEARILRLLSDHGGTIAQEELSQMIVVDRSNTGRALQRLEQKGYLARTQDAEDKRAKRVTLSDMGSQAADEVGRIRKEGAATFFGDLTESEAGEIVRLLRRGIGS